MYDIISNHRVGDTFQLDGRCDYRKRGETLSKRSLRLLQKPRRYEEIRPNKLDDVTEYADGYRQAINHPEMGWQRSGLPCPSQIYY